MAQKQNPHPIRGRWLIISLAIIIGALAVAGGLSRAGANAEPATAATGPLNLSLDLFASGFNNPVGITSAGGHDGRLFVIEKAGLIKIAQPDGSVLTTPFLDIRDRVDSSENEEGLLGLAFHPEYTNNGYFYLNFAHTNNNVRRTRIARFRVSGNPNQADPNSEDILLTVVQPYGNHNAGDLHFGPEGYLYIPLGDGGSGGDPDNNAQNLGRLLGKVLRINVDSGPGAGPDCKGNGSGHYTIPFTNPFRDGAGGNCDEIWASGLRNPWQSSFDRLTGDFFIGDVGQNSYEEVNFQAAASSGGENYGWRCYEGNHAYNTSGCGPSSAYTFPIFEYNNPAEGCSVIGGYVYRGQDHPFMVGHYLLTDYCSGTFWDLLFEDGAWQATQHDNLKAFGYVAFGEDAAGELYVVNRSSGNVYRIRDKGPVLSISKSGPTALLPGQPITYTLTVQNSGNVIASNIVVSDTIPSGATYVPGSGGSLVGSVVRWEIGDLAPSGGSSQVTFAITAATTIVNDDYWVTADGGYGAIGKTAVQTVLATDRIYLPLAMKP